MDAADSDPDRQRLALRARDGAARLRALGAGLVDIALPHRCIACSAIVMSGPGWCPTCWADLDFLAGPACARCDLPLEAVPDGGLCGGCIADPPPYERVHVPLGYGAATRSAVLRLKYGRRVGLAKPMAQLMATALPPVDAATPPLLVPVPLHRWRLWSRGFNQAMALAGAIGTARGLDVIPDALVRTKATVPLRGLGRKARARTVQGAFAVPVARRDAIAGRAVWLVDDVFTTGATVAACARTLKRAGAASVAVVAFARVIARGSDDVDFILPPPDINDSD